MLAKNRANLIDSGLAFGDEPGEQGEGVNHAFHNDTSTARYNEAAAKLAWSRTLEFFKKYLA